MLPTGFTEKMRFLTIRGEYLAAIATGTHEVTRRLQMYGMEAGYLLKSIPRHGGIFIYEAADFDRLPVHLHRARLLRLSVPPIQGVMLANRGDSDPLRTDIIVNCTIEDLDAEKERQASESQASAESCDPVSAEDHIWDQAIDVANRADGEGGGEVQHTVRTKDKTP